MKRLNKEVQKSLNQVLKLAAYRDEYLSIKQRSPRFERACQIMGLSPETVRRCLPELVEKWYDRDFRGSTSSEDVLTRPFDEQLTRKV